MLLQTSSGVDTVLKRKDDPGDTLAYFQEKDTSRFLADAQLDKITFKVH